MRLELEARLLAAVGSAEQWQELKDAGLTAEDFISYRPMYDYIAAMVETHGKVPRLLDLRETFRLPDKVMRDESEFRFLMREFQQTSVARKVQEILDSGVTSFGQEPSKLLSHLIRELMAIQSIGQRHVSITDATMNKRLERYRRQLAARPKTGPFGIRTGLTYFDDEIRLGWLPGELIGVVGRTYIGKSWLMLYFGQAAWQSGRQVLFISPEMSVEETEARFDALLMAKNGIRIDTADLYRGYAPSDEMEALAERVANSARWVTYSSSEGEALGLVELSRLVRQHNPDLLLVDGLPLLEARDGRRGQVWETIKALSYGLKNLAVALRVAIVVSHQANRQAHNTARPPSLHEVSFGDSFAQACDRVLALSQPSVKGGSPLLRITIMKFRKGEPKRGGIDLHFEPAWGRIFEEPQEVGASELAVGSLPDEGDAVGLLLP